jgi:hypothetical protein
VQKRHFERLASAVRRIRDNCENDEGSLTDKQLNTIIVELADVCQQFSSAFNRTRFREACEK